MLNHCNTPPTSPSIPPSFFLSRIFQDSVPCILSKELQVSLCRTSSLLGSFENQTYNFKEPTNCMPCTLSKRPVVGWKLLYSFCRMNMGQCACSLGFHVDLLKLRMVSHAGTCSSISRLLKLQVSFANEPYKTDDILQKRPIILRSLLIVATPYCLDLSPHMNSTRRT